MARVTSPNKNSKVERTPSHPDMPIRYSTSCFHTGKNLGAPKFHTEWRKQPEFKGTEKHQESIKEIHPHDTTFKRIIIPVLMQNIDAH